MVSNTTILSILTAIVVWSYLSKKGKPKGDVALLPGPAKSIASWIWGHELLVFEHEATEMYTTWTRLFGSIFRIKGALFHPDIIIVADQAAAQHIFGDPYSYVKSPAFRPPIANSLGEGLVWAEGEDHKLQRKILQSSFTQEAVRGMASDIALCAERLEARLNNQIMAEGKDGVIINMVAYTSSCTLDIIGRVAFGHDFKSKVCSASEGATDVSEAGVIQHSWNNHVRTGLQFSSFLAPLLFRAIPSISKAPLPIMKTQGAIKVTVKGLARRILEREERLGLSEEKRHGDILRNLLSGRRASQGEKGLTDEQVLDNIVTLTMVGHETTAGSINFTLWELARHSNIQARLRAEINEEGGALNYDDIQRLPLLDAVVKEGLRLHPASPQTERLALRDDVIPLKNPIKDINGVMHDSLLVQAGQVFFIPFTTLNCDETVWGPDAAIFRPDRWLEVGGIPSPSDLPHGWSGLTTFCDGPRNCIGWRLAVYEFKVILATLIRSFEFCDTRAVVHSKISPTLQPVVDGKGGHLPLLVKSIA